MRIEPYDPKLGCLTVREGSKTVVVCPAGKILSRHDDEYEARNEAMFRNLTGLSDEELGRWQTR